MKYEQGLYEHDMCEIQKLICEEIETEYYGIRNCTAQFRVHTISGKPVSEEVVLLISLDKTTPEINMDFYGKLEIFLCQKETGMFGKDKLRTKAIFQKIYTKEQQKDESEKVQLTKIFL